MANGRPELFTYLDYRAYMRDYFAWSRQVEPDFSLRTFAGKVSHSLSSSGLLSAVLKGKRNLSQALRHRFAKAMGLRDKESEYFDLLVQFNQARGMEEKNHFFQRLAKFRESKAERVGEGQYSFYSKWYYLVVWCYFGMERKQRNPAEIAKRINPPLSPAQVEEAIAALSSLKLIKRTANGYAPSANHIYSEESVKDMVAYQHHLQFIDMARQMLERVPAASRLYNTLVFYVSKAGYEAIKERVNSFQEELRDIIDKDKDEDRIYTLSLQLYPNSKVE